jgi:hypothetical protein
MPTPQEHRHAVSLKELAVDFANALKIVDSSQVAHKQFSPGIGPYGEADAVRAALSKLRDSKPKFYAAAVIKRIPDLLIPRQWAVEFKIARPFGDNGLPAEHWSENLLHPYEGNTSSLGDCLKLLNSGFSERKAVIIIGYEHTPPRIALEASIRGFEVLAREVMRLRLSPRIEQLRDGLIHRVHQQLRVFAYEVLGTTSPEGRVA